MDTTTQDALSSAAISDRFWLLPGARHVEFFNYYLHLSHRDWRTEVDSIFSIPRTASGLFISRHCL